MYGYNYMKKIILRQADLKEYVIAERDFKYIYPSDFEDLYLLNLKGHLNHLSPDDKKTQLNLTKPRWDATGFEFKHDYTVIDSPRAVTFRDRYGVQMIMRFNEIHKFSDGTLQQIDEALDYRVKEFRVNRTNPGMNTRFWTKKDVVRSKEFMFAIQKRLKTRRIFRNLESFVGGRIREGDYRVGSSICAKPFRISMHILRGSEWYMMAIVEIPKTDPVINLSGVIRMVRLGDSSLRGIYLIKGLVSTDTEIKKDGDGEIPVLVESIHHPMLTLKFPYKSLKDFDELMSTPTDFSAFIMNVLNISNLTQETFLGPAFRLLKGTRKNYAELEYDFEECYKVLSKKLDWENPEGGDYPFDLFKPLPLITHGKRQRVPFEFFINNDLKYLQGGISTMTYTTSTTKTKAAQYDLPGIKNMVPNIWSHVKRYAIKGRCVFDKRILAVTHVLVMRKYGYEYIEEIVVRRADNNRLSNLLEDDVADFAIALRISPKKALYTPYKDPQGFIYVNDNGRNRLMRFDELYKFSDGTLSRLLSSLEDITKNINMSYLPKRRWSTLEKKRAHFMINDINKLLKERRMMRSLEKFVDAGNPVKEILKLSLLDHRIFKDGGEGYAARAVPVPKTFHEQTEDELTEVEIKQMEADDQAIQTILLGLLEDIYDAIDSCETAQEIW
ncbi:hypothetical protein Tco_1576626 [Tanacetum coccineum]